MRQYLDMEDINWFVGGRLFILECSVTEKGWNVTSNWYEKIALLIGYKVMWYIIKSLKEEM